MNTQELKCFLRVADRLNFTRAAQELYLTAPTVTHHIQKLEEELGVQLFLRDSKSVQLTAAGEIFYRDAKDIIIRMEGARIHLENARIQEQKLFRIGCTSGQESHFLTDILMRFRRRCPETDPRITIGNYYTLVHMLGHGQLDIVLGTRDMSEGFEGCRFTSIRRCSSFALFRKKQAAVTYAGEISLHSLHHQKLILLRQANVPQQKADPIEQFASSLGHDAIIIRQDDAEAVIALASAGYGVGILPEYVLPRKINEEGMICLKLKESPIIEYGLILPESNQNEYVRKFIDSAFEAATT